jgi:hypothetical protein
VTLSWEGLRYAIRTPQPLHHRLAWWRSTAAAAGSSPPPPGLDSTFRGGDVEDGGAQAWAHEKELLRGVEGIVHPGELCAIMGASGTVPVPPVISLWKSIRRATT